MNWRLLDDFSIRDTSPLSPSRIQWGEHWIPSHIQNTSVGKLPIRGNVNADKLARLVLEQEDPVHKNLTVVKREILILSTKI
jgi:hypothetical protein